MLDYLLIDDIIWRALKEDMPMGDITTESTVSEDETSCARLIAKEDIVVAGIEVFCRVFILLDSSINIERFVNDGDKISAGTVILKLSGNSRAMLKAERTALNLLQRMSGIATATRKFVDIIEGTNAKIVDTRKTAPGLRYLDKMAVRMGGGTNHRFCLSDGVLIKDNHIKASGGITAAVEKARVRIPHTVKIEVETESLEQVKEALSAGADIIMLDNMKPETMKEAVSYINGKALTEASGNITADNLAVVAKTGVDLISSGSLTHSVKAADISLKFE
ncbi:MAG TPA: carboxylating nicotinate-nucleotide diphosphorylase [Clostridiaceae bacterium]|mgnify:CR=1 FL=1|jgi:nicotinate-nucleotide pyrophosphorylase (carboxylating)|nr:carboxylating nicotinate-nucleotide diphosphorylase [Clostridiaceae bacterium]